jgi:hypothetical protein
LFMFLYVFVLDRILGWFVAPRVAGYILAAKRRNRTCDLSRQRGDYIARQRKDTHSPSHQKRIEVKPKAVV